MIWPLLLRRRGQPPRTCRDPACDFRPHSGHVQQPSRKSAAHKAVAVVMLTALAGAGCDGTPASGPQGTGTTSTMTPTSSTSTTQPPSALDDLAPFFAAAAHVDANLKAAARAVNGGIGSDRIVFDQATVGAVEAADPAAAGNAIPAGMPPALLQSVLVVYNDLVSRRAAFNRVNVGSFTPTAFDYAYNLRCLHNGAAAAAQYATDVAAARSLAATLPHFTVALSDSRATEELAVRIVWIRGGNNGCANCGGFVIKDLVPITWYPTRVTPPGSPTPADGTINTIPFSGTYVPGKGWDIVLQAC